MKKVVILIVAVTLLFTSCGEAKTKGIVNQETATAYNGYVYFLNYNTKKISGTNGAPIYRQKSNGSGNKLIADRYCVAITILNNRIYYKNETDGGIWSVDLKGEDEKQLTKNYSSQPSLMNGSLYFIQLVDKVWKLYKYSGTGEPVYMKDGAYNNPLYNNDVLYYHRDKVMDGKSVKANAALCALDLKTLTEKVIVNQSAVPLSVKDDYLYFSNLDDIKKLYKIKKDDTKATNVTPYGVSELIFTDKNMYLVSEDNATQKGFGINGAGEIYVADLDGNNKRKIGTENTCASISLVNKWIYYTSWTKNPNFVVNEDDPNNSQLLVASYRVKASGGASQKVK